MIDVGLGGRGESSEGGAGPEGEGLFGINMGWEGGGERVGEGRGRGRKEKRVEIRRMEWQGGCKGIHVRENNDDSVTKLFLLFTFYNYCSTEKK